MRLAWVSILFNTFYRTKRNDEDESLQLDTISTRQMRLVNLYAGQGGASQPARGESKISRIWEAGHAEIFRRYLPFLPRIYTQCQFCLQHKASSSFVRRSC